MADQPRKTDYEAAVQACYATWSGTYYDAYYGADAPYPPVHRDILRRCILEAGARTILDAGCGPASFLRDLAAPGLVAPGLDLYGFDLTAEMVDEARRVMAAHGVPGRHFWQGSVTDPVAFFPAEGPQAFDMALCVGVLPHIPATADAAVIANLHRAVRPGGTVVVEARNQLFGLFTLNRYAYQLFVDELIRFEALAAKAGEAAETLRAAMERMKGHFRMDLPPRRTGTDDAPGYDEVLSRTHNPHVLQAQFEAAGFEAVQVLFYHYHCLPPLFEADVPDLFRAESLAMEDPEDWRGYYMASAFFVVGRRP